MTKASEFERVWAAALTAGMAAGEAAVPVPMVVGQAVGFGGEIDYSKPTYYVAEGVCGFAWVGFAGNTAFGRWAKRTGRASRGHPTGLWYWVGEFGQSMARKEAFARAFAAVLQAAGIEAYARSRMD